jgi:hypothetical protein
VTWLCDEFRECPPDADKTTVTLYTRAWVWHMFATVMFPDDIGDVAFWMYIPALADWSKVGSYSRDSAMLAYLYLHLCEVCRCRG